ncbi:MAG: hypothetical protein HY268_28965 [Deltaproteobacteria bacterium]|nr:hypothetical protein [Deltaproteobacteria bacterium]
MKTKMKQVLFGLSLLLLCTPHAARAHEVSILIVYYSVTGLRALWRKPWRKGQRR